MKRKSFFSSKTSPFSMKVKKKKPIRKRQKVTVFSILLTKIYTYRIIIIAITGIILLGVLGTVIIQKTIYAPQNKILDVRYDSESINRYNDSRIYSFINDALLDKNYYSTKRFTIDDILKNLQDQFPLVKGIKLGLQSDQVGYVTLFYHDPAIVFLLPGDRRYASYDSTLYPLGTGESLGDSALSVQLPRYSQGLENIDGIFYQIPEQSLISMVEQVFETLGKDLVNDVIYLPGGEKLFIAYKSKRIYIHLNKDIQNQLAKLIDLETHYERFNEINTIDLGSVDDIIVK